MSQMANVAVGVGATTGLALAGLSPTGEAPMASAISNLAMFAPPGIDVAIQLGLAIPGVADTIDKSTKISDAADGGATTDAVKTANSSFSDAFKPLGDIFGGIFHGKFDLGTFSKDLVLAPFHVLKDLTVGVFNMGKDLVKNAFKMVTDPIGWIKGIGSAIADFFCHKKNMSDYAGGIKNHADKRDKNLTKLDKDKNKLATDTQNGSSKEVAKDEKHIAKDEKNVKKEDKNLSKDAYGLQDQVRKQELKIHYLEKKIETEKSSSGKDADKHLKKDEKKVKELKDSLQTDVKKATGITDTGNQQAQEMAKVAVSEGLKDGDAGNSASHFFQSHSSSQDSTDPLVLTEGQLARQRILQARHVW